MNKFLSAIVVTATATALMVAPVSADDKVDIEVDVAVKLDSGGSISDVVDETEAVRHQTLIEGRRVHEVTVVVEMKLKDKEKDRQKELDKAIEKAVKEAEKADDVEWAVVSTRGAARDDRFFAWPSSTQAQASSSDLVAQPSFSDLELHEVHRRATGAGVVVAVLDTGVDRHHPLLAGRVLGGYDMVDGDSDPSERADGIDQDGDGRVDGAHGHGTFVSGVALQVSPDATILPVRVLDDEGVGDLHDVIEGIDYAIENGADVINLSFGMESEFESKELEEAVKRATKADVVVVAAAGNNGSDREHFPASVDGVVSVNALASGNVEVASYSNRGKWITLAAPGTNIVSSVPGGGYARWSGTSMAAPVVAGSVAVLSDANAGSDAKKVVEMLVKPSRKLVRKNMAKGGLELLDALR